MVAPLVLGAVAIGSAMAVGSSVRGVHQGIETRRYWRDYKSNTGFSPRYPVRSGLYDTVYGAFGVGSSISKGVGNVGKSYYSNPRRL